MSFFLQLDDADIREEEIAQSVASYIQGLLVKLNPGDELRVSLFPVGDALQLTLVGRSITSPVFPSQGALTPSWDLVEVRFA